MLRPLLREAALPPPPPPVLDSSRSLQGTGVAPGGEGEELQVDMAAVAARQEEEEARQALLVRGLLAGVC